MYLTLARDPKKQQQYINTRHYNKPLSDTNPTTGTMTEPLISSTLVDYTYAGENIRLTRQVDGGAARIQVRKRSAEEDQDAEMDR